MGNAVWLYMWLIDKMTEISEGVGIVNGGYPVTHAMVQERFKTLSDRQYRRYVRTLKDEGYVNTMKAKHGLYITVNKPKKYFNQKVQQSTPAKNGLTETKPAKTGQKRRLDRTKMSPRPDKKDLTLYKEDNTNTKQVTNNSTNVELANESPAKKTRKIDPHKELISKLYYEAIKALDIPVRNHNNLKSKIGEMARDPDKEKIINYLKFMRDQYPTVAWDYKPHISEALDIFNKRGAIRDTFTKHVKQEAGSQPLRFGKKK